ncbi:MAG: DUF4349 domain-containing protein [bacterium]|nr:DUF4349 domain-containing protein [bacterium]
MTKTQKWYLALAGIVLVLIIFSQLTPQDFATSREAVVGSNAPAMAPSPMLFAEDAAVKSFAGNNLSPSERVGGIDQVETAATGDGEFEQRIIKQAEIDLLVDTMEDSQASLQAIAKTHGGFVRDSSVYERQDKTLYGQAVLRVEVSTFEAALSDIRALALNVQSERVTGTDVTEQFTDLQAQLHNAQEEEKAYLALLSRAGSVSDLLEVQRELSQVRGRIEMFEGRLKYLTNQTDLATITISLSEKPSLTAPTGDFRLEDTIKQALQTLIVAFQEVVRGLIWLVIFGVGVVLPISILAWAAYKLWKRYR